MEHYNIIEKCNSISDSDKQLLYSLNITSIKKIRQLLDILKDREKMVVQ